MRNIKKKTLTALSLLTQENQPSQSLFSSRTLQQQLCPRLLQSSRLNTPNMYPSNLALIQQVEIALIKNNCDLKVNLQSSDDEDSPYSYKIIPTTEQAPFVLKNIEFLIEYKQLFQEGIRFGRQQYIQSIIVNFRRDRKNSTTQKITKLHLNNIKLSIKTTNQQKCIFCSNESIVSKVTIDIIQQMQNDFRLLFGSDIPFKNYIFIKWQLFPDGLKIAYQEEQNISKLIKQVNRLISKRTQK
ncbi:hypothetical protein SS50377_23908 [Spironucleus salmonicida]|uniref:Uncharacterized protein n=1 Tax=Spironucleus salmonicida TaxID=348837 RepID=V6LX65_9EUKA|nr:hypothetical protein SS50377_23908 [Spironucleus salmonicida]|eukprot:EST48306.1 Hypothetical protein SS50377_11505 [Spironucleus salmonicida]